jgi:hypothetical protein
MKKIILSVSCLIASSMAFAGGGSIKKISANEDGPLSNGFYLNLGASFLNTEITSYNNVSVKQTTFPSYGVAPTLELGNQWYFFNTDNIGIGLKATWLQVGYSSISKTNNVFADKGYAVIAQISKIAPQFTFAFDDKIAVDASFGIAPESNNTTVRVGKNDNVASFVYGTSFSPGLRVRYSKLALGFEYTFGTLKGSGTLPNADTDYQLTQKVDYSRIYLGFQF